MPKTQADRIPKLARALNFRDLGGYATADRRSMRWGRVYRSGTLHDLTLEDLALLQARGIRYAYDLRSTTERRNQPSRLTAIATLEYGYLDREHVLGDIKHILTAPDARAEHSYRLMVDLYKRLPYELEEWYRPLFRRLVEGKMPLVFNCTAGKDRTGVAAALLLTAVRVPRDRVLGDYLLTNQFFEQSCEMILNEKGVSYFLGVSREVWEPLMRVHPDYLHSMFDQLEQAHGSVERYLSERLGLEEQDLERLRSNLLD